MKKIANMFFYRITALVLISSICFTLHPFSVEAQERLTKEEFKEILQKDQNTITEAEKEALNGYIRPGVDVDDLTTPENAVNCFDYYKFGSVQVDLSPVLEQTISGTPFTFVGKLKNTNPYPIVNGSVYVKIFKTGEENFKHQNGYPLVAFFEAGKDISIPANAEKDFSFEWKVPQSLSEGSYEADFFFVTDHRFNLLGLSFTDDVTGNKAGFSITANNSEQIIFDKNQVTLNKKPYSFATFPPHFVRDEAVTIDAIAVNPSDREKTITVTWQLYNWDGLRSDFLLDTKVESYNLKPHEKLTLSYTATTYTGTVSYVLGTITDGDATSIINPRFVRDDIEEIRLNFPSLYTYPLEVGKETTLFSCVHSTSKPFVEGGELTMTLTDADTNDVLHTYTYTGGITGAMMGVKDSFVPSYTPQRITLTTTLTHNGKLIDTVSATYDCVTLTEGECPQRVAVGEVDANLNEISASPYMLILVFTLILALLAYIMYTKRRTVQTEAVPQEGFTMPKE